MKKLFILFMIVSLMLTAAVTASASERFANMQALWDHWVATAEEDALSMYPEGVCGVWCDGDMSSVTIAVTKDEKGEAAKQAILDSLEDAGGVSFTYAGYSHAELRGIQRQLEQRLTPDEWSRYGIRWMGVDEQHNVLAIGIDTNDPDSKEFIKTMFTMYHDRVVFEHSDDIYLYVTDVTVPKQADTKVYVLTYPTMADIGTGDFTTIGFVNNEPTVPAYLWIVIPMLTLAIALMGTLIWLRKRGEVAVLSTGETEAATHTDAKQAVRDAAVSPSPDLDRRILDKIRSDK